MTNALREWQTHWTDGKHSWRMETHSRRWKTYSENGKHRDRKHIRRMKTTLRGWVKKMKIHSRNGKHSRRIYSEGRNYMHKMAKTFKEWNMFSPEVPRHCFPHGYPATNGRVLPAGDVLPRRVAVWHRPWETCEHLPRHSVLRLLHDRSDERSWWILISVLSYAVCSHFRASVQRILVLHHLVNTNLISFSLCKIFVSQFFEKLMKQSSNISYLIMQV